MDIETSEQLAFIPEQVESILMAVIDGILRTEVYLEEKVCHGMGWNGMQFDVLYVPSSEGYIRRGG